MHEEIKYWFLRDHKLFGSISSAELKKLCVIMGFKKAKKGEMIFFSTSDEARIYFLKKGAIKIVSVDEAGGENIRDIIQKGDLFGGLELQGGGRESEFAQVMTNEVVVCSFLVKDFEQLMIERPQLALSYTKLIGLKLKKVSNNYKNLVFKDARSRLLIFLTEWAEKEGRFEEKHCVIENYLTQADLAQLICTTRQTTTTLLNELENEGLISYSRKQIFIPDWAAFRRI